MSVVRAELRRDAGLAREVLGLAKKRRDPLFRMAAHTELGGTALVLGTPAAARRHFRLAEALDDPAGTGYVARFGMDMGIFARIWATHLTWQEGYPDRARARADETMASRRRAAVTRSPRRSRWRTQRCSASSTGRRRRRSAGDA